MTNANITRSRLLAPQPGDRFTYQGTFWVHVVAVLGPYIVAEEYGVPCIVPDDARLRIFKSAEHFYAAYSLPDHKNQWIQYFDNDAPLSHVQPKGMPIHLDEQPPAPILAAPQPVSLLPQLEAAEDTILELVAEHSLVSTGATGSTIAFSEHGAIVCRASKGVTAPRPGMCLDDQSGLLGECVHTDRVLKCDDTEITHYELSGFRRAGIHSLLIVPLRRAAGIVGVFSSEPYAFEDRHVAALCITSEMLSSLLEHRPSLPVLAKARPSELLPALN